MAEVLRCGLGITGSIERVNHHAGKSSPERTGYAGCLSSVIHVGVQSFRVCGSNVHLEVPQTHGAARWIRFFSWKLG